MRLNYEESDFDINRAILLLTLVIVLLLLVFISLCYINTFCKSVDSQIFYYLIGLISFFFGSTSWEFMTYLKNNK